MLNYFCLAVTFLDPVPAFHGQREAGDPEWPPSPLRLFQALVAAAAARWGQSGIEEYAKPALIWLASQDAPVISTPEVKIGNAIRISVPNNDMDVPASFWVRGQEPRKPKRPQDLRALKAVCATYLRGGERAYYLWRLSGSDPDFVKHREVLIAAARSITHLGWGIDMVAAEGSVISDGDAARLPGQRWKPTNDPSATGYRVPTAGTLRALIEKHHAFLNRISPEGGFIPVPPLSDFDVVGYRRTTEPAGQDFAAFSILRPDASGFRPFDMVRRGIEVSAMMRHAAGTDAIAGALGWSPEKVATFVLGHGENPGEAHAPVLSARLAFIPIPSIEPRGEGRALTVAMIRRALIVVMGGPARDDLLRLARLLSGAELFRIGQAESAALLSRIPDSDSMVKRYTAPAATWATVTPVILPGYDDPRKLRVRLYTRPGEGREPLADEEQKELLTRLDRRIDLLLRKAIRQAGYSDELAQYADLAWRPTGFWPGTELATSYRFPEKLRRFRRLHVRIAWRDANGKPLLIRGPICLGGGRFQGLGLFAPIGGL